MVTVFSGNWVESVDPFMFFPDPRVPMAEVNRRGEFVFWRTFEGKHVLKRLEMEGKVRWIDAAPGMPTNREGQDNPSSRAVLSAGDSHPGFDMEADAGPTETFQIDQGTIDIIPAELGLSDSEKVEKWLFTIANKGQIIQAEPYDSDHGFHPVVVSEPYSMGYGFGQPGLMDYLGPLQDVISWFVNSHIQNVRTAINNMFIVDPSMVEMQDLKNPEPGKIIRLKRAAYGQDVRTALQQLAVTDITRGHIVDLQAFFRIADSISGVNDNLRGLQESGGRKTATEVRTAGDAGASRLAAHGRMISAQSLTTLTEMMSVNTQQLLDQEFELQVLGQDGMVNPIKIGPEHVVGDFYYPINDGTLPIDRVAMLDVWKELFLAIVGNPLLAAQYDAPKIFEYVAKLGGADNLSSFRLQMQPQMMPDGQVQQQMQAGNVMPVPGMAGKNGAGVPGPARGAMGGPGSSTPGIGR
jgi:hypothetical protein